MSKFCKDIGANSVDTWGCERTRYFLELWSKNNGSLTSDFSSAFSQLIVLECHAEINESPEILHVGSETIVSRFLRPLPLVPSKSSLPIFEKSFRRMVAGGHHAAIERCTPQFHLIKTQHGLPDQSTADIMYERLILPVHTSQSRYLLLYSEIIELNIIHNPYLKNSKKYKNIHMNELYESNLSMISLDK